jgi:hypothetical protein
MADIDSWRDAPTIQDYRERAEQITGIDFEGAKPRDLTWKDWKNLVHFLETEVENADTSETQEGDN